jgi:hemerythrin-like domain-containing protein
MTTATSILRTEHEAIMKVLDAAEEAARQLKANQKVKASTLIGLLEFLQLFADRCHHGKEEDLLFPLLADKGMPRSGGPIAVMLHEHEIGRNFIKGMAEASDAYSKGDVEAGLRWAEAAHGYVELLREHIYKENNVLFVMAERMLSDADQEQLVEQFEKVEEEKLGRGTHERLHALMEALVAEIFGGNQAAERR